MKTGEFGYTKVIPIPFEIESLDFDWISYFCGINNERRHEFEMKTGCNFTFLGKLSAHIYAQNKNNNNNNNNNDSIHQSKDDDLLKIQLIALTPNCLKRGMQQIDTMFNPEFKS